MQSNWVGNPAASERHDFGRAIEITSTQTHESPSFLFCEKKNNFTLFGSKNPHPGSPTTTILLMGVFFPSFTIFLKAKVYHHPKGSLPFDFQGIPIYLGSSTEGNFKFPPLVGSYDSYSSSHHRFRSTPQGQCASRTTDKIEGQRHTHTHTSLKPHDVLNDRTLMIHSMNLNVWIHCFHTYYFQK